MVGRSSVLIAHAHARRQVTVINGPGRQSVVPGPVRPAPGAAAGLEQGRPGEILTAPGSWSRCLACPGLTHCSSSYLCNLTPHQPVARSPCRTPCIRFLSLVGERLARRCPHPHLICSSIASLDQFNCSAIACSACLKRPEAANETTPQLPRIARFDHSDPSIPISSHIPDPPLHTGTPLQVRRRTQSDPGHTSGLDAPNRTNRTCRRQRVQLKGQDAPSIATYRLQSRDYCLSVRGALVP